MRHSAVLDRGPRYGTPHTADRFAGRGVWFAIAAIAVLLSVVGAGLLARRQSATPTDHAATLGGLSLRLHDAGWLSMDGHNMDNQGGYQMPAQMMPGAPVGDDMRLGVPVTLVNTSDEVRWFNLAEEFFLRGGRTDQPRTLHSDTLGRLNRLAPGSAVDGVLYFDTVVPDAGDPSLYLEWRRAGDSTRLTIPLLGGPTPDHGGHSG